MKLQIDTTKLHHQLAFKLAGADGMRLDAVQDLDAKLEAVAKNEPRAIDQLVQAAKLAMVTLSREDLVSIATARAESRKREAAALIGQPAPFAGASNWGPRNVVIPAPYGTMAEKELPAQWKALESILPPMDRHDLAINARAFQAVVRETQAQLVSLGLLVDLERYGSDQPNNKSYFVNRALEDACSIVLRPFDPKQEVKEADRKSLGHAIGQAIGARARIVHLSPEPQKGEQALLSLRINYYDDGGRRKSLLLPIQIPHPKNVTSGTVLDAVKKAVAPFKDLAALDASITAVRSQLAEQRRGRPEPRVNEELEPRLLDTGKFL